MCAPTIVWFRQDLRLADNPALDAASKRGGPVIPVYLWSPEDEGDWPPGAASRWWLHQSLRALDASLRGKGSRLILARGKSHAVLGKLVAQSGADAVYCNRRYEPAAIECESRVAAELEKRGVQFASSNSALLAEPTELLNLSGNPYRVYTPYLRRVLRDVKPSSPLRAPPKLKPPREWPHSEALSAFKLMPKIPWYAQMAERWSPGEEGAQASLKRFLRQGLANYRQAREQPAKRGTSGLSPHLHFGEIGPRQIWHALGPHGRASTFLHQLVWREFAYHLLYHFPETPTKPLRPEFARFPWRRNARHLSAWQKGRTGIPMVDAGMRELWSTGVMHNRVRMIVASFLAKNLLQPWQDGARWFWDTLVDADLANNTMNWQWVAGSGADAAPYFRIFNPLTQGKRYDPEGAYVSRWIPELTAGSCQAPIVDLATTREAALDAYAKNASKGRIVAMDIRFTTLDVFTDRPFGGNPLAVLCDQPEIPTERMQTIARELNLSETVFIVPPRDARALRRLRIFAPTREMLFAGHPTIGAAHALVEAGIAKLQDGSGTFALELEVGLVPITVTRRAGGPPFVQLTTARLPERVGTPPSRATLARVLGLGVEQVMEEEQCGQAWSCGTPFVVVPVRDRAALAAAKPDSARWTESLREAGAEQTFVFCRDPELPGSHLRARMFAPDLGIGEDPATGSAAAAFAGYLAAREAPMTGTHRWVVEQGFEMGRPSILHVEADVSEGRITAVRVGGTAVRMSEGTLLNV